MHGLHQPYKRREWLALAAGLAAAASTRAQPEAGRVVVVGGGFAGATFAKYLRLFAPAVDITMVEPQATSALCPMSNRVLHGSLSLRDIMVDYAPLSSRWGVRWLRDSMVGLDADKRLLRLASGASLPWDRLVLAPGVEFRYDEVPGMQTSAAQARVLHAWKAGAQTLALRDQLRALPRGGVVALHIPKAPFRCPPGPYERASLVAEYLMQSHPGAKLLVLDANPQIQSKRELFEAAWKRLGPVLEYLPNVQIESIETRAASPTLKPSIGSAVRADVLNLIPPQSAPALLRAAGLVNRARPRWCPVDFLSYESTLLPRVHVLGDAIASAPGMPKSAHMANAEAKVCAAAVAALLRDEAPPAEPILPNTCYSFISRGEAMHVAQVFRYDATTRTMAPAAGAGGVSPAASREEALFATSWALNIMADSFG